MTPQLIDKIFDIIVNLISALLIFVIPLLFYYIFSKVSFKSYFTRSKRTVVPDRNYFKIGWKPNGVDRFKEFQAEGYFAIAWPEVGDLTELVSKNDDIIRDAVRHKLINSIQNKTTLGQVAGYFVRFLNIKKGDIVVTSRENRLYMYTVKKSYYYSEENERNHTSHRIEIDKKSEVIIPFSEPLNISPKFKRVTQNRLTIISLNDYASQIDMLLEK